MGATIYEKQKMREPCVLFKQNVLFTQIQMLMFVH